MKRVGQIIAVKPEKIEEYKKLHREVWPGVKKMIYDCNIRNYSIFLKDGLLFAYFEYIGEDYETDMARMAADEETQRWWSVCMPCQQPVASAKENEWWSDGEEVFHQD